MSCSVLFGGVFEKQKGQRSCFLNLITIVTVGVFCHCEQTENQLVEGQDVKPLTLSETVLQMDTILVTRKSMTYRLILTNQNDGAINVHSIKLQTSPVGFKMFYKGVENHQFDNVFLRGRDSITLFFEANLPRTHDHEIKKIVSKVEVKTDAGIQKIPIEAYAQDVETLLTETLSGNVIWKENDRFFIPKMLTVEKGSTLTVQQGTKLFFQANAGLRIEGTLVINGDPKSPVILRNDRFDTAFKKAPGMWQGVYFESESTHNELVDFHIENATNGSVFTYKDEDDLPDVTNSGGVIRYIKEEGLSTKGTDIKISNSLIHDCGQSIVTHTDNGYLDYNHCTLSHLNTLFNSNYSGFRFENVLGKVQNSILWGSQSEEIVVVNKETLPRLQFQNNIIKTTQKAILEQPTISVENPLFLDPLEGYYQLTSTSPAIDKVSDKSLDRDLEGQLRDKTPDIGAYEFVTE